MPTNHQNQNIEGNTMNWIHPAAEFL